MLISKKFRKLARVLSKPSRTSSLAMQFLLEIAIYIISETATPGGKKMAAVASARCREQSSADVAREHSISLSRGTRGGVRMGGGPAVAAAARIVPSAAQRIVDSRELSWTGDGPGSHSAVQ